MSYEATTWAKGDKITSTKLNKLEEGLAASSERATTNAELIEANAQADAAREQAQAERDAAQDAAIAAMNPEAAQEAMASVSAMEERVAAQEAASAANLEVDNEQGAAISALYEQLGLLQQRLDGLQTIVDAIPRGVVQSVSFESDVTTTDNVLVQPNEVTGVRSITARSITVDGGSADSARLNLAAKDSVIVDSLATTGDLAKAVSNTAFAINNNGAVVIRDCDIAQTGYNIVEIGLAAGSTPSSVLVDNCTFHKSTNNGVLVFDTLPDAVVTVKDCVFKEVSNAVRLSNRSNVRVTLRLINCDFQQIESDPNYRYVVLCQDNYAATPEEAAEANRFAPDKVTIECINCTCEGEPLTADKVVYVYRNQGGLINDPACMPTVVIR